MIKQFWITGDTHGDMRRFRHLNDIEKPKENAIIVLGDAGVNYFFNHRDKNTKESLKNYLFRFYLVRGNHEARPEDISSIKTIYDDDVKNYVYMEEEYPSIRYLMDGEVYCFNGVKTLVIGGAYSVDKHYRQKMGWSWFANEQLSEEEWNEIFNKHKGNKFDLILTHTCPISWEPTDLFLDVVDQSTVDKFTENKFEELKNSIDWGVWLFGHYHASRLERPYVEMYYMDISSLDEIMDRWKNYKETNELEWWLLKSPNFNKN